MRLTHSDVKTITSNIQEDARQAGAAAARTIPARGESSPNVGLMKAFETAHEKDAFSIEQQKAVQLAQSLLNPNNAITDIFNKYDGLITLSNEHANSFGQALQKHVSKLVKGQREEAGNRLRLASQMFAAQSAKNPYAGQNIFSTMLTDLADRVNPIPASQRGSIYGDIFSKNK